MKNYIFLILIVFCFFDLSAQEKSASCTYENMSGETSELFKVYCMGERGKRMVTYEIVGKSKNLSKFESDKAIKDALSTWRNATGVAFKEVTEKTSHPHVKFLFDYNLDGSQLADARVYGCEQDFGDVIRINENKHTFSNDLAFGTYDLETVMLHEIGHVLGFAHNDEYESIMYYQISPSEKKVLNISDLQGAQKLFPGEFFSTADNIRGWSWDWENQLACYIYYDASKKQSKLIVRHYNGLKSFTEIKQHRIFSTGDNIRGLSWDIESNILSYVVYEKKENKTYLCKASFDGENLGQGQRTNMLSSGDNIRGWSWNTKVNRCSYIVFNGIRSELFRGQFDGVKFKDVGVVNIVSTGDNMRAWSWDRSNNFASYFEYKKRGNQSILYKAKYDGIAFTDRYQ
ncbi:MAG: matrixin family metalloprotease [Crocinitomicaceae bacterium]